LCVVRARGRRCYHRPVSLAQLRYFVVVAEEKHVTRAARRLHISQPPLSRQIRGLEDELGTPLFERTPRGLRLLPAGEVMLARARQILAQLDDAVAAVRDCAVYGAPLPNSAVAQN
jgi:DNA-binding transcriptional LysR family regulator